MSDGTCGAPMEATPLLCTYDLNHEGPHSWAKYANRNRVVAGITHAEVVERASKGSPAAQAILSTTKSPK